MEESWPKIVVDDRERRSGIYSLLLGYEDLRVEEARLETGDFLIEDTILFERKRADDFDQSLLCGRLFQQAGRLRRCRWRPAFILEGETPTVEGSGLSWEARQGALVSLALVYDIPLLRSRDSGDTAKLLVYTARQVARLRRELFTGPGGSKAKRLSTRRGRILQQIPGVGPDRAGRLLDRFGSVRDCFNATADELTQVEGIGPKLADEILRTVEGPVRERERLTGDEGFAGLSH